MPHTEAKGFDPQKILDSMSELTKVDGPGHVLTVKGLRDAVNPIKVGELFGMEVWADPLMPSDTDWYITKEKIR